MLPFVAAAALVAGLVPAASAGTTVIAHFMVQNAYAYDVDQWKTDMTAAQDIGIDGFALNWIPPDCQPGLDWTVERVGDAFTAAEEVDFKLVHSFDMSYSDCDIYWNTTFMQDILEQNAGSSATYRWNSNILVTTYGGDAVDQYGDDFFQTLKNNMKSSSNSISLAPALTQYSMAGYTDPTQQASKLFSDYSSIDGYLNWQAWPLNTDQNITATPDQAFQSALKDAGRSGPYIMTVSPWQYKDLNDGNPLDSWVAYSDTLFPDRFQQLTSDDIQPDIIELLTWNDYCESHYLRDLPSQDESASDYVELGTMGSYVYGQEHSAWRIIAKYYISWWKTGSAPVIEKDQVVFWYRIHPKGTICEQGSPSGIRNYEFPEDAVFAFALVNQSATISMSVGTNKYWTFHADSTGPTMGQIPFPSDTSGDGVTPEVAIVRNGVTQHLTAGSVAIQSDCSWQNFNPVVGLVGDASDL